MQNLATKTVREIALESPSTTRVFEEFKIDYCCGGRRSLDEACSTAGVDPKMVEDRLEAVLGEPTTTEVPEDLAPSALIDHILATHHVFTATELERLEPLMDKVCSRHGEQHPELFQLQSLFGALAESLVPHMRKEESVLFPYIKDVEMSVERELATPRPHFGTVANPIRMMMSEHDTDGERLRKMRETANDYTLPEGACPSYTALYAGLKDLERDLHRHIHLENNVLFPAAITLESSAFE